MVMRREVRPNVVPVRGVDDPKVKREIDSIVGSVDRLSNSDIAGARLITGLKATIGVPLRVEHGLGRKPKTWWVCNPRVATIVSQYSEPTDKFIVLSSVSNATFDLMVI